MKPVIIALKLDERKALEVIVQKIQAGRVMLQEGSILVEENQKKLWEILNSLYPTKFATDKSFEYENFELRYFEPDKDIEKYKLLKEKAVKDQDWDNVAKYRDLERKAKEKEQSSLKG